MSPYKQVSREGRLASGIGEQTLDMLDRGGEDLLDELLRFANPKQRKTITLAREGGEVVEEILDSTATARTINAFNKTRAIMNNPELVVKFPAYSLSQQRGLMREVLEFVSWQENRYARRLVDDEGLGSLSDAIDRYFIHRNKNLNPNGYAEAVASAEADPLPTPPMYALRSQKRGLSIPRWCDRSLPDTLKRHSSGACGNSTICPWRAMGIRQQHG